MNIDLNILTAKINEERTTNRLQKEAIDLLQERIKTHDNERTQWINQRNHWKEKEAELTTLNQSLSEELEEAKRIIQELEEDATILQNENQDLNQKLDRETMTVENLNSLIVMQVRKISELEHLAQQSSSQAVEKKRVSSSSTPRTKAKLLQSNKNLVQQSIHASFSRNSYSSHSPVSSPKIPHSTQSSQNSAAGRLSTVEVSRSSKRPFEVDENEPEPSVVSTKYTSRYKANSPVRNKKLSTTSVDSTKRNKTDSKENEIDLSEGSPSPPAAYYFEKDEVEPSQTQPNNNIIDLSSIPSLESVIDHTSPIRQECEKGRSATSVIKNEELEEETADFTSLLCPTPRAALSDATNNATLSTPAAASSKNIPKGKNPVLKTTTNTNLLNDVVGASNTRHQHGAGQTCKACSKFYDTEPLLDVENNNAVLNPRDRIQLHSKHRNHYTRSSTPPGFWDIDFTLSSQGEKKTK